ncbi:helix-turn-helix domain-containing protein [Actinokineospora auranticolor]|uniref:AcrR family transcriptional regulator n=1 Tax=Actinokineospora auranticolor TaxID=155976 RepID=A0A2S6GI62_9PSEU|nr:TetR/AcrR family transcriptional regulator [Actinokineospora auranticolor]PPK64922.1 AcrR family transcriptional regulator [Actinokineospora auranticolor]
MTRLTRAQTQERNRARVIEAAHAEFAERGFRDAKIDAIAERAGLTRGGVYSNFPGKRALYFAVLAGMAETTRPFAQPGTDLATALGAFAAGRLGRLDETGIAAHLDAEITADPALRLAYRALLGLNALLLGLAMERLAPPEKPPGAPDPRRVRQAEAVLTTLHGATRLATTAPGFVEPFDAIGACENLATLSLDDWWAPPQEPARVDEVDLPWAPRAVADLVSGSSVVVEDGVVAVLGLHRAPVIEESARAGLPVTAVLVTNQPDELLPLAHMVIAETTTCVRQAFPRESWPTLKVTCDPTIAPAVGLTATSDATELAVRVENGRITAKAEGPGACHAVSARKTWVTA